MRMYVWRYPTVLIPPLAMACRTFIRPPSPLSLPPPQAFPLVGTAITAGFPADTARSP